MAGAIITGTQPVEYPMRCLPHRYQMAIADEFDADYNRYRLLADKLGVFGVRAECIWNRGLQGQLNSGTLNLLKEYQAIGGTVQGLYRAFYELNHQAMYIIRDAFPCVRRQFETMVESRTEGNGQQNSCSCQECHSRTRRDSQQSEHFTNPANPNSRSRNPSDQYVREYPRDTETSTQVPTTSIQSHNYGTPVDSTGRRCDCETCRLRSDPNETQLLTYYNDRKENCSIPEVASGRHVSNVEPNKGAKPKAKKVCAKSINGTHFVGDRPDSCLVCSSGSSSSLRHSWPSGNEGVQGTRSSRGECSSERALNQQNDETIYSRNPLNNLHSVDVIGPQGNAGLNGHQNIPESYSGNDSETNNATVKDEQLNRQMEEHNSPQTSIDRQSDDHNHPNGVRVSSNSNRRPDTQTDTGRHDTNQHRVRPVDPSESTGDQSTVFVTYCPHSNQNLAELKTLIGLLQQARIRVKIDMAADCFDDLRLNRNAWLDRSVNNAKYVLICISPTYHADVSEPKNRDGPSPRISQLNAMYIYDRLRTEYINNQSKNKRMIPILFRNSGATYDAHVPPIMQSTLVYTFPQDTQKIINLILGFDRQLPEQ